ncbi:MAG: helix-turn-helix domain-containing protein, partial [Pirellulaceae bacterium]
IKAAEEFILGHLTSTIRVADIASAVGISVPTLNRAFRKRYGYGPKAFVKLRRLERVQSELLSADPMETTVTEIAGHYGFWHLSQFASDYQKQFGELPSHTLKRRQG